MASPTGASVDGGKAEELQRCQYGLSVDSLLAADEAQNADLFWALRGGGGCFGAVTAFTFRLHPVGPEVMFAAVMYPYEQAWEVLRAWRAFTAAAPDPVSSDALIRRIPPVPFFPAALHGAAVVGLAGLYAGPVEEGVRALQPLRTLGRPLLDMSGPMPYVAAQSAFDAFFPAHGLRHCWKSLYLDGLDDGTIEAILAWAEAQPSPLACIVVRRLGGAISTPEICLPDPGIFQNGRGDAFLGNGCVDQVTPIADAARWA